MYDITIGGKHTWKDWHLVPSSRPVVNPPEVKTEYLSIPGADGEIDLTSALGDGSPVYGQRTGSWEFVVKPGRGWVQVYQRILEHLHGRRLRVILSDDPNYYYEGRLSVNQWRSEAAHSTITIDYTLSPYKYSIAGTGAQDWLWNDLFSNVIYYGTFDVSGSLQRNLINPSGSRVTPKITCSAAMEVAFHGSTYRLPRGLSRQITLSAGDNVMTFTGTGRVNVDYAMGRTL
jgi:hypothetical protein